jgi:hypothetical protein
MMPVRTVIVFVMERFEIFLLNHLTLDYMAYYPLYNAEIFAMVHILSFTISPYKICLFVDTTWAALFLGRLCLLLVSYAC